MGYQLTFLATTKLWTVTTDNIVDYPSTHNASAGGPYTVEPQHIAFDPVHQTGGTFWLLIDGPYAGYFVSSSTNLNGYGSISVSDGSLPATPGGDTPMVNPGADWRVLIKGMGSGGAGTHALTFNADTQLWTRTSTGIIAYDYDIAHGPSGDGTLTGASGTGPYRVNPVTVPYDPVHETGGSFWELKEGPNVGDLVSAHSNSLGYGDISVAARDGDRGPGAVLATLHHPNPHLAGFSKMYNTGGEFHMTLLVDDPNILVPIPKQTHYSIEFEQTEGMGDWVEVAAGLVWDLEQTDTECVFYGVDYLALLQFLWDERFDPSNPDRAVPNGSKYVNQTITYIVTEQLEHAIGLLDSPVNFIKMGSIATMTYRVTIYSALAQCLTFVTGLLDSWRAGTEKLTELRVQKNDDGDYEFVVEDNPGVERPELELQYGLLAQGYQIREFDKNWASRVNMIGRDPTGHSLLLQFQSVASPQSEALWGRIGGPPQVVESIDLADMKRRALQAAIDASRIGRKVGIGTKLGSYRPWEAYNMLDMVPVLIQHGAVDTAAWSNDQFVGDDSTSEDPSTGTTGLWAIIGLQWESYDDGHWITTPLLYPKGKGAINFGNVQGAFGFFDSGDGTKTGIPSLELPTTPGNILIAFVVGGGQTTVFPDHVKIVDNPDSSSTDTTSAWTNLGSATSDYTDMNEGGPDPSSGQFAQVLWRRVGDAEKLQRPAKFTLPTGDGKVGTWLYEVPATVVPEAVGSIARKHVAGNPMHFVDTADHTGNDYVLAVMTQVGFGFQPISLVPDSGTTTITSAALDNDPTLDASQPWNTPWVHLAEMPSGGTYGNTFTPIPDYTSGNFAAIIVKLPDGVILPAIPHPADQVVGQLTDSDLDSGPGDPPPPASGEGYGPPTVDTPATSTYTDLLTGITYTRDPDTGDWTPISGSGYSDSGYYEFSFSSSTTWTINHMLTGYPSVHLMDSSGNEIRAHVQWVSTSQIVVTFSEAVAGRATLR